ncbi:hypothetical protein NSB24_02020 [Blautia coccoides]|uniref:hypothetical protein n=1 Tax=Lachnospiraceae TaxID=186803 RepID=UPI00214A53D9|nr:MULTISPECIES: hypothetical protein [Lachnospiraceae]MCR1985013.1 hypothetical protein [Blautia coccoides]MCU0077974.1 hypothetical protein [Extibacter muris]
MQESKEKNISELLNWLRDNPDVHSAMKLLSDEVSARMLLQLMDELHKGERYELMYGLLMKCSEVCTVERAVQKFLFGILIEKWEEVGTEQLYLIFREHLKEEIELFTNKQGD